MARTLEAYGITTLCLSISRGWSEKVPAPRSVLVRFPYGAALGEAGAADQQRAVLRGLLQEGLALTAPGQIAELPYRWRRDSYPPQDLSDLEPRAPAGGER